MDLTEKYTSVYSAVAYDLVETTEDYSEYVGRRKVAERLKGTAIVLQERCESNRNETTSRLQTAKKTALSVVERTYQEMQMQVGQRYEKANEELNALIANLEKYTSDKHYALSPSLVALSGFQPAGAVQADCSLLLEKTLVDHNILIPSDEVIPQKEKEQKLRKMTEIAYEVRLYTAELLGSKPH
jgi:hypothetical protein